MLQGDVGERGRQHFLGQWGSATAPCSCRGKMGGLAARGLGTNTIQPVAVGWWRGLKRALTPVGHKSNKERHFW